MLKRTRLHVGVVLGVLVFAVLVLAACSGTTPAPAQPAAAPAITEAAATEAATEAAATEAAADPAASATEAATEAAAGTSNVRVFTIDQGQSEARFRLDEELMGAPKTVVGVTPLVEGSISIDMDDMSKSTVSTIQIDARDLRTDEDMRNRALRRFILQSADDKYQYITFTPTSIEGLPAQAKVGDTLEFKVTGDLKIRDVSKPATFTLTVKVDADNQLSGQGTAQVTRTDFDLQIPSVPGVANVTDEVSLELSFVAKES